MFNPRYRFEKRTLSTATVADGNMRPLLRHAPAAAMPEAVPLPARAKATGMHVPCKNIVAVPARRGSVLGVIRELIDCRRTTRILRNTTQRVLLLHAEAAAEHYRRILVPVDLAWSYGEAVRDALLMLTSQAQIVFLQSFKMSNELVLGQGMSIEAIHACKEQARATAKLKLDRFVNSLNLGPHLVSRVTHHGEVLPLSVAYAARMNADLIVVGRPERYQSTAQLTASPAWQLRRQAGCDVLVAACTRFK